MQHGEAESEMGARVEAESPHPRHTGSADVPPLVARERRFAEPVARRKPTWVYFVHAPLAQRVKIGIAADPWLRVATMQTGSPERLTLLGAMEGDNAREIEQELHNCWRPWHSHGEWFEAIPELLEFVADVTRDFRRALDDMRLSPVAEDPLPEAPLAPSKCPQIPAGIEAPAGNSKAAKLARYKLARGIPV